MQFLCILTFCSDWSEAGSEMVRRLSSDGREVHSGIGVGIGGGKPRRATFCFVLRLVGGGIGEASDRAPTAEK